MKCEECKFWEPVERMGEIYLGNCLRFPPTVLLNQSNLISEFPVIGHEGWCGEFQHKEIDHED